MAKRRKGIKPNTTFGSSDVSLRSLHRRFPNILIGVTIAIIILVIGMLAFNSDQIKSLPTNKFVKMITGEQTLPPAPNHDDARRIYIVNKGDSLWTIAEQAYGSGFNAYDIARANHINNPSAIEPGQRLSLPSLQAKEPTRGEITETAASTTPSSELHQSVIHESSYTIQRGDCLWTIAERKYGDGMMWSVIARANNLSNPDLIFSDNTLSLP